MAKKDRSRRKKGSGDRQFGRSRDEGKREPSSGTKAPKNENSLKEWAKSLGVAAVLFLIIRTFVLQTFVITSGSMENTLLVGDFLLANRAVVGGRIPFTQAHFPGIGRLKRGDVVVFDPHHDPDLKLVKRLVAMGGDTVSMEDGVFLLNGIPQDEPYVQHLDPGGANEGHPMMDQYQPPHLVDTVDRASYRPTRDNWGPLVVPEDSYFMLGDNRDTSLDSRYWGPLESWRAEGRASFIYYSFDTVALKPFKFLTAARFGRVLQLIR